MRSTRTRSIQSPRVSSISGKQVREVTERTCSSPPIIAAQQPFTETVPCSSEPSSSCHRAMITENPCPCLFPRRLLTRPPLVPILQQRPPTISNTACRRVQLWTQAEAPQTLPHRQPSSRRLQARRHLLRKHILPLIILNLLGHHKAAPQIQLKPILRELRSQSRLTRR